ncbi:hypothetical protein [Salidesulfovibrio brasiliensis]|uniref:hypothetical protein n=1 Tax=Salidesulfovibrio brasiliensis TaxID=221711 RepID=UPI0012EE4D79|nr:hypothetical protein [Salidesulfovibrio brasiliensis]
MAGSPYAFGICWASPTESTTPCATSTFPCWARTSARSFGRLQFEAGKLQVERKIGLDPLRVMAALSRNDTIGLRIYDITLSGLSGYVRGEMAPDRSALNSFLERLSEDDAYAFTLTDSVQAEGAVRFTLEVGRR